MKKTFCKWISCLLAVVMLAGLLPATPAMAADTYTLNDGYIEVTVSGDNGGFSIRTAEGDKLIKSDNDKDLIHPFSQFDTSFTSFEVTYTNRTGDDRVKEYLFGGNYSFLGLGGNNLTTTKDATGIVSEWTVDGLTFTQRIELVNQAAAEHGMVYISYQVKNTKNEPVSVKARVLLDTALGDQDYAIYEMVDEHGVYRSIEKERVITEADNIPANFFAYDDNMAPSITAYTVNSTMPYQIAFAHWNSLASTLFSFAPDTGLTFTNQFNDKYLTADSAVAYYYDMGTAAAGASGSTVTTYYGVYSNRQVSAADSVSVNLTAPTALTLAADKKTYLPSEAGLAPGVFSVQTQVNNYVSDTARDFSEVTVAAYASNGITPLDENGIALSETPTYLNPYTAQYFDFSVGGTQTRNFYFKADVGSETAYRKVEIRVFDTSTQKELTQENLVGSRYFYILCPGGDGKLPEITFTGASPQIIYHEGTRHLYLTGRNFNLLQADGAYNLRAYSKADPAKYYDIPYEQISFPEDVDGENIIDVAITEAMLPGSYELVFDWTGDPPSGINKRMTAPALNFTVSNDVRYKNDYYGIVAVVQVKGTTGRNSKYELKTYKAEDEWEKDKGNYEEALLVFRGSFDVEKKDADKNPTKLTATSIKKSDGSAGNVITINNCIDFEMGTVTVEKTDNAVTVDFDGDLLTSVKRSKIWSGVATFTEIKDGTDFDLVKYNNRGDRLTAKVPPQDDRDKPKAITLLWPSGRSIGQTISGMVFNLAFGELGVVYDVYEASDTTTDIIKATTTVKGYCLSFSASLDLSFLVPGAKKADDGGWAKIQEAFSVEDQDGTELRNRWNGLDYTTNQMGDEDDTAEKKTKGQANVMVRDILYGCGEGFMGVNFNVSLTLPSYTDGMPVIKGKLAVNTIGGWKVAVDGEVKFTTIEMEASLTLIGHNGIPIPDKLYFYIGGFEPGINVDGFGVLWITGGGGGFDNLYDTIFCASGVPPLKLMLSVSFDILKVLQARVDLSISLRGLSLKASDIGIKYLKIIVLKKLALSFEWYPEFYFMASVNADILKIINGSGYIVIMEDDAYTAFVEFFIRATVTIPEVVPLLGGISVGGVDLGANNDRIWGALKVLGITLGITYYWGEDVHFGTGSGVKPSFPDLLDYPVGVDAETGQTLYMRLGGNVSVGAMAEIVDDIDAAPRLLGAGDSILSAADRLTHRLTLGAYSEARALTITYAAQDENEAKTWAQQITITNGSPLSLNLYDPVLGNADTANANLSYDDESGKAIFSVTFTDASVFEEDWNITTPVAADLLLYDIAAIPEITALNADLTGDTVNVRWDGSKLGDLDSLSFYLTSDPDAVPGENDYPLGSLEDSGDITPGTAQFKLPENLQTGEYYVRAVYSQQDVVNGTFASNDKLSHVNQSQPADPSGVTMVNSGDLNFTVSVANSANTDYDGYMLSLYEWDGTDYVLTDFAGMQFEKTADENGALILPVIRAGGSYTMSAQDEDGNPIQKTVGLTAGKQYKAGISAYKYVYENPGDEDPLYTVYSNESFSGEVTLLAPTPPNAVLINATTSVKTLTRYQTMTDGNGNPYEEAYTIDTFGVSDVAFDVGADVAITGSWVLDDGKINGAVFAAAGGYDRISLSGLEDGDHTITIRGTDDGGDSFFLTKTFAIDTKPPKLMLTSPTNGSFFSEYGRLTVSGVTDPDAKVIVVVDGEEAAETAGGKLIAVDPLSGAFSFIVSVDPAAASHYVQIFAVDQMENSCEVNATVVNRGLGNITGLQVYMDGAAPIGNNLPSGVGGTSAQLSLAATTGNGNTFLLDNSLVEWSAQAVEGSASIDTNGVLSASAGSMGVIVGRFYVSPSLDAESGLDAAMVASATFGDENNYIANTQAYTITFNANGGSVTPATTRTGTDGKLQSLPTPARSGGYRFDGWFTGANGGTQITTSTVFTTDATVYAHWTYTGGNGGSTIIISTGTEAKAGELVSMNLPQNADENVCAPYCYIGGVKTYVKLSAVTDGKLLFIAPYDATYYVEENKAVFSDITGHWAEQSIRFTAARELFMGVSSTEFDPDGGMTRAMFVAILGRLSNVTVKNGATTTFRDVQSGSWYAPYVSWAAENGIVTGYSATAFGPNDLVTREQMCTMLKRYIEFAGYSLPLSDTQTVFTDQASISSWASGAVMYCQKAGLVQGKSNGMFDPLGNLSRAEASAVFERLIKIILKESMQSKYGFIA